MFKKLFVLSLIFYIGASTTRMLIAYVISLLFSLSFGIFMGHNEKAFRYLLPFMDILQSAPILGFLPVAILYLIGIPYVGPEVATIFLIWSCMTWSTLFNVVEGVRTIPNNIKEVAKLFNIRGAKYLTNVVLPAIYPQVVSGAITGWGGGWYFLVAGEYSVFGGVLHQRPGIGYFIASSAYDGNILFSLIGIGALAAIVLLINTFVWTPLLRESSRYKEWDEEDEGHSVIFSHSSFGEIVEEFGEKLSPYIEKLMSNFDSMLKKMSIDPTFSLAKPNAFFSVFLILLIFVAIVYLVFIHPSGVMPYELVGYAASSIFRILMGYILVLIWTVAVGVLISKSKLLKIFSPLFDIGQSIPAVAVFPIIVVMVVNYFSSIIGLNAAIELSSILLLMTGMQWYLLFNILRSMENIPSDVFDLSKMLNLNFFNRLKEVVFPAILPGIIAGSIQAVGGGWNATIVSEYIVYKHQVLLF